LRAYYRLCPLERARSIRFEGASVHVDLDAAAGRPAVTNDEQLVRATGPDTYLWLSGGGSVLLEGRWLLVVERSPHSRINAGKLSLFTGRADTEAEWLEPRRLIRELFEELIVVDAAGAARPPRFSAGWVDARAIHRASWEQRGGGPVANEELELRPVLLPGSPVTITSRGTTRAHELLIHVNQMRDINALYVLECDLTLDALWAVDGEADERLRRRIFALDVATLVAINVTSGSPRTAEPVDEERMTEHCRFLIRTLRQRMNACAN
jgi:hypothetical protein